MEENYEEIPIIPENLVKLSVGKIILKLSANFNVSETAIDFLTDSL